MWTGHSVNDRLAMTVCSNLDTSIKFLIQRQLKDPSCIELLFKGVTRINIVPSPENYDSIIYESNLGKINDEYFWVIDTLQTPSDLTSTEDSWITAKKLSWRATDEFMDDDLRYGGQT